MKDLALGHRDQHGVSVLDSVARLRPARQAQVLAANEHEVRACGRRLLAGMTAVTLLVPGIGIAIAGVAGDLTMRAGQTVMR